MQLIKNEPLEITYSYWDGTGHRRKVVVKKGDTIADFLKACRDQARAPSPGDIPDHTDGGTRCTLEDCCAVFDIDQGCN